MVCNESVPGTVITVTATDMAGNKAKKTLRISLAGQGDFITEEHLRIPVVSASAILSQMEGDVKRDSSKGYNKVVYSPVSQAEIDTMLDKAPVYTDPAAVHDKIIERVDGATGPELPASEEDPPPLE
jgi:hypothetical protein